jgi:hypothetical protein
VLETLAYLATVDLTPILPQIAAALVLVGRQHYEYVGSDAQPGRAVAEGRLVECQGKWVCATFGSGTMRGHLADFVKTVR